MMEVGSIAWRVAGDLNQGCVVRDYPPHPPTAGRLGALGGSRSARDHIGGGGQMHGRSETIGGGGLG